MKYKALALLVAAALYPGSARADDCQPGQVEGAYVDGEHVTTTCHEASSGMDPTIPQEVESPGDHDAGWEAADTSQPGSGEES